MEDNKITAITGIGKSHAEYVGDLTRAMLEVYKNEDTNPINLGITVEEFNEMNEVMEMKPKKKSNGFLEGKKMNKILGKRK